MTRLERIRTKIADTKKALAEALASADMLKVKRLRERLDTLQLALDDAEAYAPKLLSQQLSPQVLQESGLLPLIVKTHMAADFLCEVAFSFREKMDSLGFADCSLYAPLRAMEKAAADYAALVCHPEFGGLQDLMVTNDKFLRDLGTLTDRYLDTHLRITYDNGFKFQSSQ